MARRIATTRGQCQGHSRSNPDYQTRRQLQARLSGQANSFDRVLRAEQKIPLAERIPTYPVNDSGGMEMLDAAEHLVKKIGHPLVIQIHLDHLAEVGVHQFHH